MCYSVFKSRNKTKRPQTLFRTLVANALQLSNTNYYFMSNIYTWFLILCESLHFSIRDKILLFQFLKHRDKRISIIIYCIERLTKNINLSCNEFPSKFQRQDTSHKTFEANFLHKKMYRHFGKFCHFEKLRLIFYRFMKILNFQDFCHTFFYGYKFKK